MNDQPLRFRRFRPGLLLGLLIAATLAAACHKGDRPGRFSLERLRQIHAATQQGAGQPTEYRLDSQPFSPTLPYLFDQARIAVLPAEAVGKPPAGVDAQTYAFSAVDRFGRLYHFDTQASWWMAEGETLPAPLPPGEWTAAWNTEAGALEILVSAPWNRDSQMHLLRWQAGRWNQLQLAGAPEARPGARRLFLTASQRWLAAGGTDLGDGWTIEGTAWKKWAGSGRGPSLGNLAALLDGPAGAAPIALTRAGAIWIWNGQGWKETGSVKVENLALSFYVPALKQVLFVWRRGRGQDQFLWQTVRQLESGSNSSPEILPQTALVRVNDRDEGYWKGWGRAQADKDRLGQTRETLLPGFKGSGEPAIQISSQGQDKVFRRSAISLLQLPPDLGSLHFEAAAWVPALNGIVAPSAGGTGLDARREPFFPREAWGSAATSASQPMIDVIEQNHRFWIFRQQSIDWLKPPYEVHPDIDYASSYQTTDGRRRCLAWTMPEPGMLRYDFHEFHDKKVQWVNSPRLTLKQIPQLALTAEDRIFTCDPVAWGDPAEVVVIGWCGRLSPPVKFDKTPDGLSDEAYTQIPNRGFMARISALEPAEWKVATLPIPFCEGGQLLVDPAHGSLYVLGGKTFEEHEYQGKKLQFAQSQSAVWHWDGEAWRQILPEGGVEPRNKVTSHAVVDPMSDQLLCLNPQTLYSFGDDVWHCLWARSKAKGEHYPNDVALYVHPLSRLVLGAWFTPEATLRVWNGHGWLPVRMTAPAPATKTPAPDGPLPSASPNLIPATQPDTFVAIDAERLNAIRMDAPRDRAQDRLMGAHRLVFRPANAGKIAFARGSSGKRYGRTTALLDGAERAAFNDTGAPPEPQTAEADADDADTSAGAARVVAGNDGKVIKTNHTGLMMRRLETLAAQ